MLYSLDTEMTVTKEQEEARFLYAVEKSDLNSIRKFSQSGHINPNCRNDNKQAAIHLAAEKGDIVVGKILLEMKDLDINLKNLYGNTALIVAVLSQQILFVNLLINHNADVNAKNNFDKTALHTAICKKNYRIITKLILYKANPNVSDIFGNTPLSLSTIECPSKRNAAILLKKGADPNFRTMKPHPLLLELCLNYHNEEQLVFFKLLLHYGANINIIDNISHHNALHIASISGHLTLVIFLLNNGANPNMRDIVNRTPFDLAVDHQHYDLIEYYSEREKLLDQKRSMRKSMLSASDKSKMVKFAEPKSSSTSIITYQGIIKDYQALMT